MKARVRTTVRLISLATALLAPAALAAEHKVTSASEIAKAAADARPGDEIVLSDGEWKDQAIEFTARGVEGNPVTLRAQTPGKVVLVGKSSLVVDGSWGVVSGLSFKNNTATDDGIALKGDHHRLTETSIVGGQYKFQVHLFGHHLRVDHCYLAEKANENPTFQIEVDKDTPNYDQVDHNHFGHRPPLGKNGGETMRIGYSGQSQWNSRATVEHNLYDRCDGEIEIISSKSCENIYRYNTFLDCAGFLTLRHGHRCIVDSNFFIAHHKEGSGGVRVINEGHTITNNYIEGVDKGGFWITSGIKDGPLVGYTRAKDCLIAFNTIVDFAGPGLELAAGLGTANRTLVPEDVTIANNLFSPGKGGELIKGEKGEYKWVGNAVAGTQTHNEHFRNVDTELKRDALGLLQPAQPILAEGSFPQVKTDLYGRPRQPQPQVGCVQVGSDAEIINRPLTAADVGPSWLKRTTGEPHGD
jgi:poly(beta-D-mannuronate) lyase